MTTCQPRRGAGLWHRSRVFDTTHWHSPSLFTTIHRLVFTVRRATDLDAAKEATRGNSRQEGSTPSRRPSTAMTERVCRPRDDERLYILSDQDIEDILADSFVDLRELMDGDDACDVLDIMHERLTDDFYYE